MDRDSYLEKLGKRNPNKIKFYNYDLLPEKFDGLDTVLIKCHQHGIFEQRAYTHLYTSGCPSCGRIKSDNNRAITTDEFIKKSKDKYGERFDYSKTIYVRKEDDLIITCPDHGDIAISSDKHFWIKTGCPRCSREFSLNNGKQKLIEKAKNHHGDKYDYSKVVYRKFDDTVEIICPTHGSFWQSFFDHGHTGSGCPKCSRDNDRLTTDKFIEKAIAIHGNSYLYDKVIYKTIADKVIITCEKHGDFIQRAGSHLQGNKCKDCFLEENRLSKEDFIKQARMIHGDKYDYSKVVYLQNKKPVEIICPTHGSFWQKPNGHVSSQRGCRFCNESKGERSIEMFLKKFNIEYIREYRILPYRYRYDFYLPAFNIYIEYNGQQHYGPVKVFGGMQAFLETKERDREKKNIVKQNGGYLVTLHYKFLDKNLIVAELIRSLKSVYPYWFLVGGKVVVFPSVLDVYKTYSIPMETKMKDLIGLLKVKIKGLSELF